MESILPSSAQHFEQLSTRSTHTNKLYAKFWALKAKVVFEWMHQFVAKICIVSYAADMYVLNDVLFHKNLDKLNGKMKNCSLQSTFQSSQVSQTIWFSWSTKLFFSFI